MSNYYYKKKVFGFAPSTKRPTYDGVNDYSKSNFTLGTWAGAGSEFFSLTSILLGFSFQSTHVGSWGGVVTLDPTGVSNSGVILEKNSSGTLRVLIYYQRADLSVGSTELSSTIAINDGVKRNVILHINVAADVATIKLYFNATLNKSKVVSNFKNVRFNGSSTTSRLSIAAHGGSDFYPSQHITMAIDYLDLFAVRAYSDAEVAGYIADRNHLNSDLYARFTFTEGEGAESFANGDPSKKMEHTNVTLPDFWQEY
tara:strand:- start:37258 stop:38025 length:768 start_codon:yes stop_codon:yes gene_type:complete